MRKDVSKTALIILSAFLIVCMYFVSKNISLLCTQNRKIAELQKEKEIKLQEIQEINRLLSSDEKTLIEKAAHERLGYLYPNEVIYVDVSGN